MRTHKTPSILFAFAHLLLFLAISPLPSTAGMCSSIEQPAATLLLPYFEVDLDDPSNGNTHLAINNASPEPALAHVILWTDWGHPSVNFNVFLTGYDVVQVNLADILVSGNIPTTADLPSDPLDQISPHGGFRRDGGPVSDPRPEWDGGFPVCDSFFPAYENPVIRLGNLRRAIDGHTGQPVEDLGGACLGADFGDNVARGYVTIDVVNRCSVVLPGDFAEVIPGAPPNPKYFRPNGTGIASNSNQLWGDWFFVDRSGGFAQGESLVHIQALDGFDAMEEGTSNPTIDDPASGYTFYRRYASLGEDNREPLGAIWATRYLNNSLFEPGGTDFIVWRDPVHAALPQRSVGYDCGGPGSMDAGPPWHPLRQSYVFAFDDFENVVRLCSGPIGDPPPVVPPDRCFPLAAQRVSSDDLGFFAEGPPWNSGWMYLDLRESPGLLTQSHVVVSHSAQEVFSVGLPAVELFSACRPLEEPVPPDVF